MIKLWDNSPPYWNPEYGNDMPGITPYIINDSKLHSAVIVCPGGGYTMKAPHEGEPIALWLNQIGLSAFVLNYRVAPYKHPVPFIDATRAIRYIRFHANKWNINPSRIGILGFSAGGHLTCTIGTHFDEGNGKSNDPVERVSSRPDAMILCYSVISSGKFSHQGSMMNLLGEHPSEELIQSLSNEKMVSDKTPPTFLWHTANDEAVPIENSLLFASALSKYKIPFELHIFPDGRHGLGLGKGIEQVEHWTDLCESWLKKIKFI